MGFLTHIHRHRLTNRSRSTLSRSPCVYANSFLLEEYDFAYVHRNTNEGSMKQTLPLKNQFNLSLNQFALKWYFQTSDFWEGLPSCSQLQMGGPSRMRERWEWPRAALIPDATTRRSGYSSTRGQIRATFHTMFDLIRLSPPWAK